MLVWKLEYFCIITPKMKMIKKLTTTCTNRRTISKPMLFFTIDVGFEVYISVLHQRIQKYNQNDEDGLYKEFKFCFWVITHVNKTGKTYHEKNLLYWRILKLTTHEERQQAQNHKIRKENFHFLLVNVKTSDTIAIP